MTEGDRLLVLGLLDMWHLGPRRVVQEPAAVRLRPLRVCLPIALYYRGHRAIRMYARGSPSVLFT
jgi:hypothetical protein